MPLVTAQGLTPPLDGTTPASNTIAAERTTAAMNSTARPQGKARKAPPAAPEDKKISNGLRKYTPPPAEPRRNMLYGPTEREIESGELWKLGYGKRPWPI